MHLNPVGFARPQIFAVWLGAKIIAGFMMVAQGPAAAVAALFVLMPDRPEVVGGIFGALAAIFAGVGGKLVAYSVQRSRGTAKERMALDVKCIEAMEEMRVEQRQEIVDLRRQIEDARVRAELLEEKYHGERAARLAAESQLQITRSELEGYRGMILVQGHLTKIGTDR